MSKKPIQSWICHVRPIHSGKLALILIDHQVGTLQFVHTMSPEISLRNAVTLA